MQRPSPLQQPAGLQAQPTCALIACFLGASVGAAAAWAGLQRQRQPCRLSFEATSVDT